MQQQAKHSVQSPFLAKIGTVVTRLLQVPHGTSKMGVVLIVLVAPENVVSTSLLDDDNPVALSFHLLSVFVLTIAIISGSVIGYM